MGMNIKPKTFDERTKGHLTIKERARIADKKSLALANEDYVVLYRLNYLYDMVKSKQCANKEAVLAKLEKEGAIICDKIISDLELESPPSLNDKFVSINASLNSIHEAGNNTLLKQLTNWDTKPWDVELTSLGVDMRDIIKARRGGQIEKEGTMFHRKRINMLSVGDTKRFYQPGIPKEIREVTRAKKRIQAKALILSTRDKLFENAKAKATDIVMNSKGNMVLSNRVPTRFACGDRHVKANYLSYPRSASDIYKIAKKCSSSEDIDEQIHYLEIMRDSISRFPAMVGYGVKKHILAALRALKPRASTPIEEFPMLMDNILKVLGSRVKARKKKTAALDPYHIAKRVALKYKKLSKVALFDKALSEVARVKKVDVDTLNPVLIGSICRGIMNNGENNEA